MKIIAFVIVLFGLMTAGYGSAVLVPKYQRVESEWMSTTAARSYQDPRHADLESQRYELRGRGQQYAMSAVAAAVIGLVVGFLGRKKGAFPFAVVVVAAVLTLGAAGYMQAAGNIF